MVCMDEMPKQLLRDSHEPLHIQPGQLLRQDYAYKCEGVADFFMRLEPLCGMRWEEITRQPRREEWAEVMC